MALSICTFVLNGQLLSASPLSEGEIQTKNSQNGAMPAIQLLLFSSGSNVVLSGRVEQAVERQALSLPMVQSPSLSVVKSETQALASPQLRDEEDPITKEGKVALSKKFQVIGSRMDAMGMCNFVRYSVRDDMTPLLDLIKARYDVVISDTEFDDFVKDTLRREHQFNSDAGITALDYLFTESFYEETQIDTGEKVDITDQESAEARAW